MMGYCGVSSLRRQKASAGKLFVIKQYSEIHFANLLREEVVQRHPVASLHGQ